MAVKVGLVAGQRVAAHTAGGDGTEQDTLPVFPVLLCAGGDAPFAAKTARACGHAAMTGCHRCTILASRRANKPGVAGKEGINQGCKVSSTAYGGAAEPCWMCSFSADTGEWQELQELHYATCDGDFDRDAAKRARITDRMAVLLGRRARAITLSEYAKFTAKADAIDRDASIAAASKPARALLPHPGVLAICPSWYDCD
jgi:hypothetical protein